jgi:TrmH family RNA methyltransferase
MIRTAAAAGADGLWLGPGTAAADHPKVLRASAGMALRFPVIPVADMGETIAHLKQQGVAIVATTMTAACPYWDWDWRSPTVILMGNEGAGLGEELQALADGQVSIPQTPGVESLNVAIAAGLLLYEAQRQRRHIS